MIGAKYTQIHQCLVSAMKGAPGSPASAEIAEIKDPYKLYIYETKKVVILPYIELKGQII